MTKMKPNKLLKGLSFVLFLFLFAGIGFLVGRLALSAAIAIPPTTVIVLALLFIPLFFIVVGIHEAGHALAGVWVRFDFRMYVIGPFMWQKEQYAWKFSWNKNVNTFGGMVICLPPDTHDLSKRFSIYAGGGPIASLVLTILAYGLSRLILVFNDAGYTGLLTLQYSFVVMAFFSLLIFLVTSIPMHFGGFSSDGARVLTLLRGGERATFETLILKLIATSSSGQRPKLTNMEELHHAQTLADKLNAPFGVYLQSFFHQAAFDRGEIEEAEKYLLKYIQQAEAIPAGIRNVVWLDAAFFYAYAKRDLTQAEYYWQQFKPTGMIPKALIYATEAAIAVLKNQPDLALTKIESSQREIPGMLDKGVGVALQDKLIRLKESSLNQEVAAQL